jgi:phosphate starvation-inducible PhoH-like protein
MENNTSKNFISEINIDNEILPRIFGSFDANIKKIEKEFDVSIVIRNEKIKIIGDKKNVEKVNELIDILILKANKGNDISEQDLNYCMDTILNKNEIHHELKNDIVDLDDNVLSRTIQGKPIKPKTIGQKTYVDSIKNNMITFGIGPAGTGKTYLGMCMAIEAFKRGEVTKLILTRPAIEAGEKLGFLPGDLQSKIDPYLRPLYDALYQIMGAESFQANLEKGLIEVAPLAYMRGRTLDNAFIILDEAQNTTIPQMKMFLTRIGFNSKVIVTGDDTQKDLPKDVTSGLDSAIKVLKNIEGISFVRLSSKDVVRHPLVQKIVVAYENYEKRKKK